MIKNFYKIEPKYDESCHDGEGVIRITDIFHSEGFATKMQFMHYTVLPPSTSIGSHAHGDDEEFYIILEGVGEMEIEGIGHPVCAGDVIKNEPFGTHGLRNTSDTVELKILVFEVKR